MLSIKYAPKNLSECVCNSNIIKTLKSFLSVDSNSGIYNVYGPTGSGKTTTVSLVLTELQKQYVEINSTQKINKSILTQQIENINKYSPKTIFIFEDIESYLSDLQSVLKAKVYSNLKIIIISLESVSFCKQYTIESHKTIINNIKLYKKYISNVLKTEKTKVKNIDTYIKYYESNIRECINNIKSYNIKDTNLTLDANQKIQYILSQDLSYSEKYNIIGSESNFIMFMIFETMTSINLSIDDRITISNLIIEVDNINSSMYKSHDWESLKYITNNVIAIMDIISKYPVPTTFKNSNIWSLYSNMCSKYQRINELYIECEKLNFSIKNIKIIQNVIIEQDIDQIKTIMKQYDLINQNVLDIMSLNFSNMKKQFKNILNKKDLVK